MKKNIFLTSNLIAHRGIHNNVIPENTLLSFSKAIDKNYIIELDIHILKDNNIVVYHDYNLYRLTKINKVIETCNMEDINKIKILNKYLIPSLEKALKFIDGKVPIIIEIKSLFDNDRFQRELVKILDNYKGECAIHTSNVGVIKWFYKYRKNYLLGLIIYSKIDYNLYKKYIKKVDFISVNKNILPIKIKNKIILGWTIKNKEEYCTYITKCDNLICENIL